MMVFSEDFLKYVFAIESRALFVPPIPYTVSIVSLGAAKERVSFTFALISFSSLDLGHIPFT